MIDLLKNKRGSQKLIILIVLAILLVAVSVGAFFYVREAVGNNIESNPLQQEQNSTEENTENNNEQNSNEVSDNTENNENTQTEDNAKTTNNDTTQNNNVVGNNITNTNQENVVYEDTYFQEFAIEKIVNKAWEKLDVSWEPVAFSGAILPVDATTRKPVIELVKESSVTGTVTTDDEIVYTIHAKNVGNEQAKNLVITDEIDTEFLEILEINDDGKNENNVITWNITTLDANSEISVSFKAKVKEISDKKVVDSDKITLANTAYVSGDNIKDEKSKSVENDYVKPVLSSVKKAIINGNELDSATNAIKVGDEITYRISVTNSGNGKAENVSIVDTLPAGTKLVSGSLTQTISTIEAGTTESVEFTVKVIAANTTIKNTATVNGKPTNSEVNPYLTISKKSDIELQSKILADNKVTTGSVLKYTIKVENNSDVDAKNVVVKDTIPQGTTLKQDNLHQISENGVLNGTEITWTIDVTAGSYKEVSFYVTVGENENGTIISNNAYVNGANTSTSDEYIKAIVSGTKESFVTRNGELVDAESVLAGDVITYKITLTNNGSLEKVVEAVDTLPMDKLENITIVSKEANVKVENGKITWNVTVPAKVGSVAGEVTLEYTALVKEDVTGTVENAVVISDGTNIESTKDPIITSLKSSTVEGKGIVEEVTTGDILVYTIKVTNTSKDVEATNVNITDVVPAGTKLVENSITNGGTTTDNKNISWNIAKIEKDSYIEVSFKVEVLKNALKDADGNDTTIANTAYVEGNKTNSDEKDYTRVNFDVEKTSNKDVVKLNEDITYTVTVTNNGTGSGEDTVTDIIPVANVDLKTDSINVTKGETEFTSPNLNWTLSLDVGESATLTYTVNVKSGTKIENSVVTPDGSDRTTTPVVTIQKQAISNVRLDGKIEYTIIVTNTSDVDATDVVVSDTLQEGLVYNNDANPSSNANYEETTKTLKWTAQTVKANSSNTYKFTVSIDEKVISIGDKIENTAYVNDTPSDITTTEVKDYVITSNKTVDKSSVTAGDTLTYTITLINSGNIAGYADIEDILSENVTYDNVSGITVTNGGSEYTATYTDGKVTVNNVKVEPNVDAVVTFKVTVNNNVNEIIKNKATVTVDEKDDETNETMTTTISKAVKNIAGNDVNGQNVKLNDTLVYSITVNNVGNKEAKSVVIKDVVPQGTTFVSATSDITPNVNNELVWNVEVPANDTLTVTFNVIVNDLANNTQITNTATVDGNFTNEVVNTYVEPIISGTKTSAPSTIIDGKVVRGTTNITYTITAKNDGGLAKENVAITDLIPEGTTFVSADDGKIPTTVEVELEDGTTATRQMLSWTVTVPANSSVSKQFVVKVDSNTTVDSITNTANIDGTDTNSTDDKVYYEDRAVRFSQKTDTIVGKNLVLVLDVSLSMNKMALPAEVDTDSPCSGGPEGDYCSLGKYYDHYYNRETRQWYHYKTKLQLAQTNINAFLEEVYKNETNTNLTVDIITFAGSVQSTVTVNKSNYESTVNGFTTYASTNIEDALIATRRVVKGYQDGTETMVIFIGDGEPTVGSTSSYWLGQYADTVYNSKIGDTTIFAIGLAVQKDSSADRVLSAIATSGEAELAQDTGELVDAFNKANTQPSYLHDDEMSTDGMIKDHAPITINGIAINVVDGTKDIVVKYGTGEKDFYTFSATETQTSIQVLNSEASQAMLATKGIGITYNETTKKFTVDLKNCTITSPLEEPVIQIIYY